MIDTVTRNPEGLLLLAAGVALLLRSGRGRSARSSRAEVPWNEGRDQNARSQHHRKATQTDTIRENVGEAARRAGEYVSQATDKLSETARSYASSAAEYADDTSQAAMDRSRRMAEQARETADYIVREQPLAVAVMGVLSGAAIAAVFPPTRIERRTLGEVGERLHSAAGAAGEQVMEAGMKVGERLGEMAKERGLTAEGLKEAAREVGETFRSSLAGQETDSQSGRTGSRKDGRPAGSSETLPGGDRR
jgi:cell division septum initiation protein DivIVA